MMSDLTPRQREILNFIKAYQAEKGYSPSIRNIGKATGIASTNGVFCHIKALERKGYIVHNKRTGRGIVVKGSLTRPVLPDLAGNEVSFAWLFAEGNVLYDDAVHDCTGKQVGMIRRVKA